MEAYTSFAKVYDLFMQDVPYKKWLNNIEEIWRNYDIKPKTVLDLGCGTGKLTNMLSQKGYEIIGVDNSIDMLIEATETTKKLGTEVLYLNQDMCRFELHKKVDCIISVCDSLNYILKDDELKNLFTLVSKYLNKQGLFIFDINTRYKYQNTLSNNNFSEISENAAYICENFYDEETNINEYYTCFFVNTQNGLYEKQEEFHYQKSYTIEDIKNIVSTCNLQVLQVLDTQTLKEPTKETERIYFVLKGATI
jgi:cyclopropane fatty-acyl-phospholipid synthase-like methyltransferase